MAKATRRVSDTTLRVSIKVSDKISNVIGGGVGKAVVPKQSDSASKKKARELLLASTIAFDEVSGGVTEGYELMVQAAKSQATGFVAKKYGEGRCRISKTHSWERGKFWSNGTHGETNRQCQKDCKVGRKECSQERH